MRYEKFTNGEYYHIYNRGVDRKITFFNEDDYFRFIQSLRVFNTTQDCGENMSFERRCQNFYSVAEQLVHIHQFALMPNHFHLLLQQKEENGISQFLQRLGTSYTKYINKKENRSGCLFESVFKASHINSNEYLEQITRYIHLNPLSLNGVNWKDGDIYNKHEALMYLQKYKFSSFFYYYNNIENSFLNTSLLRNLFATSEDHIDFLFRTNARIQDQYTTFL